MFFRMSRSRLGLEGWTLSLEKSNISVLRVQRLGLESRVSWLGLVNIHAVHQAYGYIMKKIMDLTRNKQVVKWHTSPVSVFQLWHCGLETFFGTSQSFFNVSVLSRSWKLSISSRSWEFGKMERLGLVSVLRDQRLGLLSVLRVWKNGTSQSWRLTVSDLWTSLQNGSINHALAAPSAHRLDSINLTLALQYNSI